MKVIEITVRGVDLLATEEGQILSPKTGQAYPQFCVSGYSRISVRRGAKLVNLFVHRVVATAFHGAPEEGQVVNHINEIKTDNRPENLEWVSQRTNVLHSLERHPEYGRNAAKGVRQYRKGALVGSYESAREAERQTGIDYGGIGQACRGVLKTFHGYTWEFIK